MNSSSIKDYILENCSSIKNISQKRFDIEMNVPDVVIICSVANITESVKIKIKYIPDKLLIETSSLRKAFLNGNFKTTFEEFTSDLYDALYELISPVGLYVKIYRNDGKLLDWGVTYTNLIK